MYYARAESWNELLSTPNLLPHLIGDSWICSFLPEVQQSKSCGSVAWLLFILLLLFAANAQQEEPEPQPKSWNESIFSSNTKTVTCTEIEERSYLSSFLDFFRGRSSLVHTFSLGAILALVDSFNVMINLFFVKIVEFWDWLVVGPLQVL